MQTEAAFETLEQIVDDIPSQGKSKSSTREWCDGAY